MKRQNKNFSKRLPFYIIKKASSGDIDAINHVLNHYDRYISALSIREFYDECGNAYYFVDRSIRRRLETKLILKILKFKPV